MISSRLLFFTIVLGLSFGTAVAQNDPTLDIGLKPYGSYHGGDLDSVNLTNGNLTLHIPLSRGAKGLFWKHNVGCLLLLRSSEDRLDHYRRSGKYRSRL